MANASKIRFYSEGFRAILKGPGLSGVCHSTARQKAAELEQRNRIPYEVEDVSDGNRTKYLARPQKGARVPALTHEQWMKEVWPRVGGAKWRPHR